MAARLPAQLVLGTAAATEFAEDAATLATVRSPGADLARGSHLHRPAPAAEALEKSPAG